MLNRYDFASSRFGISGPNTSRNDKNIPCSPPFHLSWQFCRTITEMFLFFCIFGERDEDSILGIKQKQFLISYDKAILSHRASFEGQ